MNSSGITDQSLNPSVQSAVLARHRHGPSPAETRRPLPALRGEPAAVHAAPRPRADGAAGLLWTVVGLHDEASPVQARACVGAALSGVPECISLGLLTGSALGSGPHVSSGTAGGAGSKRWLS